MNSTSKRIIRILLVVALLWLSANLILYIRGHIPLSWTAVFALQNRPAWTVGAAVLLIGIWLLVAYNASIVVRCWHAFRSLHHASQATIVLSICFYLCLLAITSVFPRLTGYSFRSDWALLVVATSPLLALLLLLLVERATSVKAKFAGIEVEFQRTITTPISQTVTIEEDTITKGASFELHRILEDIRARQDVTQILVCKIRGGRSDRSLEFLPLRNYVYELSRIAPLRFIVFVDENDRYLAFMSVQKFKSKYPKFAIESLLEDINRSGGSRTMWEGLFGFPLVQVDEVLDRVRSELVIPMWDRSRERPQITERDLDRLGAIRLHIQNPEVLEAFQKMREHRVAGIPVVDDKRKFIGVATEERIVHEVITSLLEKDSQKRA